MAIFEPDDLFDFDAPEASAAPLEAVPSKADINAEARKRDLNRAHFPSPPKNLNPEPEPDFDFEEDMDEVEAMREAEEAELARDVRRLSDPPAETGKAEMFSFGASMFDDEPAAAAGGSGAAFESDFDFGVPTSGPYSLS
jgi:hypothetical protein